MYENRLVVPGPGEKTKENTSRDEITSHGSAVLLSIEETDERRHFLQVFAKNLNFVEFPQKMTAPGRQELPCQERSSAAQQSFAPTCAIGESVRCYFSANLVERCCFCYTIPAADPSARREVS